MSRCRSPGWRSTGRSPGRVAETWTVAGRSAAGGKRFCATHRLFVVLSLYLALIIWATGLWPTIPKHDTHTDLRGSRHQVLRCQDRMQDARGPELRGRFSFRRQRQHPIPQVDERVRERFLDAIDPAPTPRSSRQSNFGPSSACSNQTSVAGQVSGDWKHSGQAEMRPLAGPDTATGHLKQLRVTLF
jgi:hypothetical protein